MVFEMRAVPPAQPNASVLRCLLEVSCSAENLSAFAAEVMRNGRKGNMRWQL